MLVEAISKDHKRYVKEAIFGFACYELLSEDKEGFNFIHRGVVGTHADANRWLRGEHPKKLVRCYRDDRLP